MVHTAHGRSGACSCLYAHHVIGQRPTQLHLFTARMRYLHVLFHETSPAGWRLRKKTALPTPMDFNRLSDLDTIAFLAEKYPDTAKRFGVKVDFKGAPTFAGEKNATSHRGRSQSSNNSFRSAKSRSTSRTISVKPKHNSSRSSSRPSSKSSKKSSRRYFKKATKTQLKRKKYAP